MCYLVMSNRSLTPVHLFHTYQVLAAPKCDILCKVFSKLISMFANKLCVDICSVCGGNIQTHNLPRVVAMWGTPSYSLRTLAHIHPSPLRSMQSCSWGVWGLCSGEYIVGPTGRMLQVWILPLQTQNYFPKITQRWRGGNTGPAELSNF